MKIFMEPVEVHEPSDKSFPTSLASQVGCSLHLPTYTDSYDKQKEKMDYDINAMLAMEI